MAGLEWQDVAVNPNFYAKMSIPIIDFSNMSTRFEQFNKATENLSNSSSIPSSSVISDAPVGLADPLLKSSTVAPTASNGLSMTSSKGQPVNVPEKAVQPFLDMFREASKTYGVPVPVLLAVAQAESNFNPKAKSATGVRGLMQVTKDTYKDLGFKGDRSEPVNSINAGAKLLSTLFKKYNNWDDAFYAYNGGHHGVTGIRNNNWGVWSKSAAKQKEITGYAPRVNQYLEQWNNWYTE